MILGIESSGKTGGVAVIDENGVRATAMVTSTTLYSQRLLPAVDWALRRAGVHVQELRAIAVSLGPGSFTGLRIGLSTAKGLALAQRLPLVGVPTLEALALRAAVAPLPPRICTVMDARQGLLYAALYEVAPPQGSAASAWGTLPPLRPLREPCACTFDDLKEWVTEPTVFAGDAALHHREIWQSALGNNFVLAPVHRALPSAEEIALLGASRWARGAVDEPVQLEPLYLRTAYTQPRRSK